MRSAALQIAGLILIVLVLAGCSGGSLGGLGADQPPKVIMAGRWMLAAPNAPPCGVEFRELQGGGSGTLAPDGGCPGQFYLSRRWTIEDDKLVIKTDDNDPLAELRLAGGRFEGHSNTGLPITLSR